MRNSVLTQINQLHQEWFIVTGTKRWSGNTTNAQLHELLSTASTEILSRKQRLFFDLLFCRSYALQHDPIIEIDIPAEKHPEQSCFEIKTREKRKSVRIDVSTTITTIGQTLVKRYWTKSVNISLNSCNSFIKCFTKAFFASRTDQSICNFIRLYLICLFFFLPAMKWNPTLI